MKTFPLLLPALLLAFTFISCDSFFEEEEEEEVINVNSFSIAPITTKGRPNNYLGCVEISSRITTIQVWDHGQIDGDIVSIIANGNTLINEQELSGPDNPISVSYDFEFNGFNYVTLFAHNLGNIAPNTCTVAINGVEFILEANLDANGFVDVVVGGFGVECSSGSNDGSGGTPTGDIVFWTNEDFGCGSVNVNVASVGNSTISSYYSAAPSCENNNSNGNFSSLTPGNYSYTASCTNLNWSGNFTITENTCLRLQLNN